MEARINGQVIGVEGGAVSRLPLHDECRAAGGTGIRNPITKLDVKSSRPAFLICSRGFLQTTRSEALWLERSQLFKTEQRFGGRPLSWLFPK
jgi:hypothetical protein